HVADQRGDDLAERAADDHADGEVDDVALHRELAEFRQQAPAPFFDVHWYVTSRISSFSSPAGVRSVTASPSRALMSALGIGETQETRPFAGSTSSRPTMVTSCSLPPARYFTVAPKNTWSVSRPAESTTSAASSRLMRKRTRRSISRSRFLP